MTKSWTFTRCSVINASPAAVWSRVVTPEGINAEMRPWLTMTMPRGSRDLTIETVPIGRPVGCAPVRLFGLLPVDYDRLMITTVESGRRFREQSTMLSMRSWIHDRTVEPTGHRSRTTVTDIITFTPRLGLIVAGPLLGRLLAAFFRHRHRRLRDHFDRWGG